MAISASAGSAAAQSSGQPAALGPESAQRPTRALVSACFVPAQSCVDDIVAAIAGARRQIRVQAYGFTSRPILRALAAARRRGIDVQVILDKSDAPADAEIGGVERPRRGRHSAGAEAMTRAGVPVWIDDLPAIAHNKLILIDGRLVIGGSYNYTASAERRNVENVTFIDSPEVADWFLVNWRSRRAVSRRLEAEPRLGTLASPGALAASAACTPACTQ